MINLTQQEQQKISDAVQTAEIKTSGEIVPMLVNQSDDYPGARWRLAISVAFLFGLITFFLVDESQTSWILWSQIPGLYLGYWLSSLPSVIQFFLNPEKVDEEVKQRALQAFFEHQLHHTKDRSGILIMVSLLERRVEILADSGINTKVDDNTWQTIMDSMIAQMKTQGLSESFCVGIEQCGDVLAKVFPASDDNPDEISNSMIIE